MPAHGPHTTAYLQWSRNNNHRLSAFLAHLQRIQALGGPATRDGVAEARRIHHLREQIEAHNAARDALADGALAAWNSGQELQPFEEHTQLYEAYLRLSAEIDALTTVLLAADTLPPGPKTRSVCFSIRQLTDACRQMTTMFEHSRAVNAGEKQMSEEEEEHFQSNFYLLNQRVLHLRDQQQATFAAAQIAWASGAERQTQELLDLSQTFEHVQERFDAACAAYSRQQNENEEE